MHATRWTISFMFVLLGILLGASFPARAQSAISGFDHARTGFPLIGAHASTDCESCHKGGRFKGTPRDCARCHDGSQAQGKPSNHPPTTNSCGACHDAAAWDQPRYDHRETTAACVACHNGSHAQGKPLTHIVTEAPCENCHKNTVTFKGTHFDHKNIAGTCASCHNGQTALGQAARHPVTAEDCGACHKSTETFTGVTTVQAGHIPTNNSACSTCHTGTAYVPSNMDHSVVKSLTCATCHGGTFAKVKSAPADAQHTPANLAGKDCGACHSTPPATFADATVLPTGHIPATGVACATCHTVKGDYTKATMNHAVVSGQKCAACHAGGFANVKQVPADAQHTPANLAGKDCGACHSVPPSTFADATAVPTGHIPVGAAACASCHTVKGDYTKATMNHSVIATGDCTACHSTLGQLGIVAADVIDKAKHLPLGGVTCDKCHTTTVPFVSAVFDHKNVGTNKCAACHAGGYANVKQVPNDTQHSSSNLAGRDCSSCHSIPPATFSNVQGGAMPANHIAVISGAACSSCHTVASDYTKFTMNHAAVVTGDCTACHGALGKLGVTTADVIDKAKHLPLGGVTCDKCHATTIPFVSAVFDHKNVGTNKCAACHAGGFANVKQVPTDAQHSSANLAGRDCASCHSVPPATFSNVQGGAMPADHIPINSGAACASCHTNTSDYTKFTMNHTVVPATCTTCHSALGKRGITAADVINTAAHLPLGGLACNTCHTTTIPFASTTFDHKSFGTNTCAACHNGKFASAPGPKTNHIPVASGDCSKCHTSTIKGGFGVASLKMDHSVVTAVCSTCHASATYSADATQEPPPPHTADKNCANCHKVGGAFKDGTSGMPSNHIAVNTANCATCHTNPSDYLAFKMDHTVVTTGDCTACHGALGKLGIVAADIKNAATHVPTTLGCSTCHKSTSSFLNAVVHANTTITTGCASCHTGKFAGANGMGTTHFPTTLACETCHKVAADFSGAVFHANVKVTTGCATCHTGAYTGANGKSPTHIATNAPCETCHTSTTTFAGATGGMPANHIAINTSNCGSCHTNAADYSVFKMDHTVVTTGDCTACHGALGKLGIVAADIKNATTHVPTTLGCSTCHKNTSSFLGAVVHANTSITTGCATCHNGKFAGADGMTPATHIPTTLACETCHKTTASFTGALFHKNVTVTTGCATCHAGKTYAGVTQEPPPPGHTTATNCESCHKSTSTFAGATGGTVPANHIAINTTNCASCHTNASDYSIFTMNHGVVVTGDCTACHGALGKLGITSADIKNATTHVPTTLGCSTCHKSTSSFIGALVHANTTITTGCATCHTGAFAGADGKNPTTHIPTSLTCETCHKSTASFIGALFHKNVTVTTGCATCHSGAYSGAGADGKPANHVVTSQPCETCHKSTTSFAGASGGAMPSNHIPITTPSCALCHTNSADYSVFTMNHTGVATGDCTACHGALGKLGITTADLKPTTHVSTTLGCSTCHSSTTSFAGAKFHKYVTVTAKCNTCHGVSSKVMGADNVPNDSRHQGNGAVAGTKDCSSCHKTSGWGG